MALPVSGPHRLDVKVKICIYSVSTNFRQKLLELSAREVEGQQFFF